QKPPFRAAYQPVTILKIVRDIRLRLPKSLPFPPPNPLDDPAPRVSSHRLDPPRRDATTTRRPRGANLPRATEELRPSSLIRRTLTETTGAWDRGWMRTDSSGIGSPARGGRAGVPVVASARSSPRNSVAVRTSSTPYLDPEDPPGRTPGPSVVERIS